MITGFCTEVNPLFSKEIALAKPEPPYAFSAHVKINQMDTGIPMDPIRTRERGEDSQMAMRAAFVWFCGSYRPSLDPHAVHGVEELARGDTHPLNLGPRPSDPQTPDAANLASYQNQTPIKGGNINGRIGRGFEPLEEGGKILIVLT